MSTDPEKQALTNSEKGLDGAIGTVAQRLKSQPLILAFGTILVLALVATTATAALRDLRPALLVIFVAAVAVWLAAEFLRHRRASQYQSRIQVSAKDVDRSGEVIGLKGKASSGNRIKVDASGIKGRVVGVEENSRGDESGSRRRRRD